MSRILCIVAGLAVAAVAAAPAAQAKKEEPVAGCPEHWGLSKVITDFDEVVDENGNQDGFICFKDTKQNFEDPHNKHDPPEPGNPEQGNSDFDDETVKDNTVPFD
jgi:hypothetical protein